MRRAIHRCVVMGFAAAVLLGGCTLAPDTSDGDPAAPRLIYLEQGWSEAERQEFYHLTQGSQLLPYAWFLALEQPDSEALFRDDAHLASLGYLPAPADSEYNPDGLPGNTGFRTRRGLVKRNLHGTFRCSIRTI